MLLFFSLRQLSQQKIKNNLCVLFLIFPGSISAALAAASSGTVIYIAPGYYPERLVVTVPNITLISSKDLAAELEWSTDDPYEASIECTAPGLRVDGLKIRHASPSIASNYGVLVSSGSLRMERCDLSSATGSALGLEGGSLELFKCRLSGSKPCVLRSSLT